MVDEIIFNAEEAMESRIDSLAHDFDNIRTGRASAKNIEKITVEYYGVQTPITQVASVKVPEAHMLLIEPWDKGLVNPICKAIQASDLGITPSNDGHSIRLPFPQPTEERRRELVKQCGKYAEEAKISIRNARRDANSKLEKARKASDITEDDERRAQNDVQKLTDKYVAKIDELLSAKEAEVMEV
ncbi:MAG: ribosome recycling factor [bacterium]|nr:ribosome recycling factor [Coriobacteriales bacterium]MCR5845817.1 ribosome recycling factor [bacterium]